VPETRKAFHEELQDLRSDVVRLGAMALESIQAATAALLDADLAAVERVIGDGAVADDLTIAIEEKCYELLARQQPMAVDLRTIVSILRVNHELQLTAHLMVSVAKTSRRLYPHQLDPKIRGLIDRMREQATIEMRLAVDAFADLDVAKASALVDMDDVMGDLQKELFRTIFSGADTDEASIQRAVQVALVGRFFERAADHAVVVGERVAFMVTGKFPTGARTSSN
jgi:phosphate transport system protein